MRVSAPRHAAARAGAARDQGRLRAARHRGARQRRRRAASTRIRSAATTANRNWASDWQPNYIQCGSLDYPFQLPEVARGQRLPDGAAEHRRRAVVPQHRRHDPARPGRRVAGRVPAAGRARLRRARTQRRAHAAVLPLPGDLERALHRPRRLHRLDQRRPRHPLVLERAVEQRAVLQQPGAQGAAAPARQPDHAACVRPLFRRPARARQRVRRVDAVHAPGLRRDRDRRLAAHVRAAAAAVHERGALPPQHGVHALPGGRDAARSRWERRRWSRSATASGGCACGSTTRG